MYAAGRTTAEFEAMGLECDEPAVHPAATPDDEPSTQPEAQPAAEPGWEESPAPEPQVGGNPASPTRSCADTDADGAPDNFDCYGYPKELHSSPETVACVEATCTADECCTVNRELQECAPGHWRSTPDSECDAWTPCAAGLTVTSAGSATQDQMCGIKLVGATVVPEAVDAREFESQVAIASGAVGTVTVLITNFEQIISSDVRVVGTALDYESAAAKAQFRAGIAGAMSVDVSSVLHLTVTDGRRRLQDDTVTISYDVVLTDPTAAATAAAAAKDTPVFAHALVQAVNEAAGGGLSLQASDVTVEPPAISTAIEYDIIIGTADTTVVSSVQEQLQDTAVMATALSAATGSAISADQVVVSLVVPAEEDAEASTTPSSTSSPDSTGGLPIAALVGSGGCVMIVALLSWVRCRKRKVVPDLHADASHSKYELAQAQLGDDSREKRLGAEDVPEDNLSVASIDGQLEDGLDHSSGSNQPIGAYAEDCMPGNLGATG